VVIGCPDPNAAVDGRGAAMLREAGVTVEFAPEPLAGECRQLIAPFTLGQRVGRPYVTLKWAETADGRVAGPGGQRWQISGPAATRLVHQLRARSDAILIGAGTLLADDPLLTARDVPGPSRLRARIVLDRRLRTPPDARLVRSSQHDVWVVTDRAILALRPDRVSGFARDRVNVIGLPAERLGLRDAIAALAESVDDLTHLLVEPGPTLAAAFFAAGDLADRVWVIRSPGLIGDPMAPSAAALPGDYVESGRLRVGEDVLSEHLNPRSPAYAAAAPSADLVLAGEATASP